MPRLTVLGSTGSIGKQALDVAKLRGIEIFALTANSGVDAIEKQIREHKPRLAALADCKKAAELKIRVADTGTRVLSGEDGVCECAGSGADTVLNSIVGMAGLRPTLAAIDAGSEIALANKEALVAGGELVTGAARRKGVRILPVDSEHSAVFQSLQGCSAAAEIKRIILTASGGPFFGMKKEELSKVTLADALKHPNWSMGAKISVDSATMMNKGLELIEAVRLFDVPPSQVDILIHRQSVVHSLVEYSDNSVIAQLGVPDMRIPIQYALTYPHRYPSPVRQLKLEEWGKLTFESPDYDTFPCINICRAAIEKGGLFPAAVNSANEAANELFRQGKIGFSDIPMIVGEEAERAPNTDAFTLEDILLLDRLIRSRIKNKVVR
ncbi:MAG: 1-deoxy-D-xylulose-5-phosphate reductoisomerase [Clostridiales bacterium]|jgi:1-deoxy-D-xylulose-5-phosphate reductoisomerase|nr:1-deoxy-D-xylulose-5-phosphate reductoisomerase [Clostridiales bacterium]